jgi:anti-sigma factor RsiW
MSDAMPECDKVLLVQAELDGELDAGEAAALQAHRAQCTVCQAATAELTRARALIDRDELYESMPADLRRRVAAQLTAARSERGPDSTNPLQRMRDWWRAGAGFAIGAACAAALTLFVVAPRETSLTDQIVYGHIRALQPGHLEDVVSTDRHTVKPWFDGRIDFAPPVKDLAAERFPLIGGRLDYIAGRPAAALVYQRDKHIIDLFTWPSEAAPRPPETAQQQGYNVVHWAEGGMAFWAVSDLEADQLRAFAEEWRRSP